MDWDDFDRELDRWRAAGRAATMWWRDDDVVDASPALTRLLAVAAEAGAPLALAVIPARATAALAGAVRAAQRVTVLQHGYAHANHAAPGARAIECGGERPIAAVLAELAAGRDRLATLFGDRFRLVLTPPWNRIDVAVSVRLREAGFCGLSTWGARETAATAGGLAVANTHADLIAWRQGRAFAGEGKVLGELARHLAARLEGRVDPAEPTGLLTHHLDHDAASWVFLNRLAARLGAHPALRWIDADEALGLVHRP